MPLPQSSAPPAATGRKQKIDWAELLGGLQQRKAADLGQLQGGLGSALDWSSQPAEARATALGHARDAVAHDEMITRMTESSSPQESWEIALQIAPELRGAEDGSFDVQQLLHGARPARRACRLRAAERASPAHTRAALLEGRENDGALPDVRDGAPGPGAPPSEVAAHQVELLRHAVRSSLLARFCLIALAALEHGARLDPSALQDGAEL